MNRVPQDHHHERARVLLVEDEEMMQTMLQLMIKNKGYDVIVASNGAEAVDMWKNEDFDLIIMDLQMPLLDGIGATRAIRSMEEGGEGKVPIIALTAHAFPEDRSRCESAGMDDYLTKPIDFGQFYSLLEKYLGGKWQGRRGQGKGKTVRGGGDRT